MFNLSTLFKKKKSLTTDEAETAASSWSSLYDGQLLVDLAETPESVIVRSFVAGMKPDQVDISLHNDMLIIRGTREDEHEFYDDSFHIRECTWGAFSRTVIIPVPVDTSHIQAQVHNGLLTVTLPKINPHTAPSSPSHAKAKKQKK